MTKNEDVSAQLRERENRRKKSVVSNMVNAPPQQPAPIHEESTSYEKQGHEKEKLDSSILVIRKAETKSRRKQILLQQSVHDRAAQKCNRLEISMNDVINQLLDKWARTN